MLLVTGASGFVGRHLMSTLNSPGDGASAPVPYLPLFNKNQIEGGEAVDLIKSTDLAALFRSHQFDGIIHLAAESRPGECEKRPELAHTVNTNATRNLLQAAAPQLPWFLYVSTDMVFSGRTGSYKESAAPDPVNEYGRSKALAEDSVRQYPGPWCIVRPALIYGAAIEGTQSMLSWTLSVLSGHTAGAFFSDELRTPVWVNDLCQLLLRLYSERRTGVFHAGGPNRLSRYEFAREVANVWQMPDPNLQAAHINDLPDCHWRPRDLSLCCDAAEKVVHFTPADQALSFIRGTGSI